jgi:hypothetical protein
MRRSEWQQGLPQSAGGKVSVEDARNDASRSHSHSSGVAEGGAEAGVDACVVGEVVKA